MSLLAWIIVGLISGSIANLFVGESKNGCFTNMLVGMIGSLLGGTFVTLIDTGKLDFTTAFTRFSFTSVLVSILGAVIFLTIVKVFKK